MRIILGAGTTVYDGWVSTNQETLDLLSEESFMAFFGAHKASCFLAEHVWEHLSFEDGKVAAKLCFDYLETGGYIRVAVPDGNLKDEAFLKLVGVGGPGPVDHPAYTHKILYTYRRLVEVFESAGFDVQLLEYCTDDGDFMYRYWNPSDGKVGRSFRYDTRNSEAEIGMASIIIDAFKPRVVLNRNKNLGD